VQQEKESDSSSSASTADVAQTTLEEPHLHGMMMSNLMQIQAAGQQTDTEATLTQADAKTEEVGQEVQAKGDWQEKADTNTVGSESIQLKCASCAAGDSVQVPESELQQHDSNSSATEVQLAAKGEKASESQIQQVAATGFSGSSTSLPHLIPFF
jgi:non-ribosomal peptide synthetase component E (peptide arylation enzyme)